MGLEGLSVHHDGHVAVLAQQALLVQAVQHRAAKVGDLHVQEVRHGGRAVGGGQTAAGGRRLDDVRTWKFFSALLMSPRSPLAPRGLSLSVSAHSLAHDCNLLRSEHLRWVGGVVFGEGWVKHSSPHRRGEEGKEGEKDEMTIKTNSKLLH